MSRFISTYLSRLRKPAFSKSWVKTFLIFDARAICFTDKILSEFALCKTKMIWVLKHILFLIALSDHRSWDYRKETLLSNRHQDACTLFEMCFFKLLSITGDSQYLMSLRFPSNLEVQDMASGDPKGHQFKRSEPEIFSVFFRAGAHPDWILMCYFAQVTHT